MTRHDASSLLVGAHTSIAGGVHNALLKGAKIGATTIQIFTANQKQWHGKLIGPSDLALWEKTLKETRIKQVMSHGSYLINLGSNKPELLEKSRDAFAREIKRCLDLKLAFLNFHPGAATGDSEEECLNRVIASLLSCEPLLANTSLRLLIETTAGQGTCIGHTFDHLGYLVKAVEKTIPIGICIDTCHIFVAGYDIRTKEAWEKTLRTFDQKVSLRHLYALHVNDSVQPLGSRKDRHASLGKGEIGIDSFRAMMTHPKLQSIPKYLETPLGETMWEGEIALLRQFSHLPTN